MSKRLNANLHHMIVRAIMTEKFAVKREELEKEVKVAEFAVAEAALKPYRKALDTIPGGFLQGRGDVTVIINGHHEEFPQKGGLCGNTGWYRGDKKDWFPELKLSVPAVVAWKKAVAAEKELEKEIQEMEAQVSSVVYGCTTVNKLLEVWPECAKFVPAEAGFNALIPLDTIKNLNKKLGL